jgi:hypothetical protein
MNKIVFVYHHLGHQEQKKSFVLIDEERNHINHNCDYICSEFNVHQLVSKNTNI